MQLKNYIVTVRHDTGKAYPEGTAREDLEKEGEVLPLPCPNTLDMFNTK